MSRVAKSLASVQYAIIPSQGARWSLAVNDAPHITGLTMGEARTAAEILCREYGVRVTLVYDPAR